MAGVANGFNPRARVGRDFFLSHVEQFGLVSIHAPAWGATFMLTVSPERS